MNQYNVGDKVWNPGIRRVEKRIICPDCFGHKYLVVILGDGSDVQIDCARCEPGGYQPPRGYILSYGYELNRAGSK